MKNYLWLLLGLLSVGTAWLYVDRILDPWEQYVDVYHGSLKARVGDLYSPWVGTRELLLHGRNPYSREVSSEIQIAFYGHPVDQVYGGSKVLDEQRFAYPIYVVLLLAPTAYIDFDQVQKWAPLVLAALTALSVILWLDVLRWRPPKALVAAIVLLVLSSPQVVQGLRLRQLGLVVGFLIALSVWCIARDCLILAGIALAFATIKPQMVVLALVCLLLWGTHSWPARRRLLIGSGSALAALIAVGEIILPGWLRFFIDGLIAYSKYVGMPSLVRLALGNWTGTAASVVLACATLLNGWQKRGAEAGSPRLNLTLSGFLICGSLVLPQVHQFNQVLLLFPALMMARDWERYPVAFRRFIAVVVPWLWLSNVALLLFRPHIDDSIPFPLLPSALTLFVPFFLLFALVLARREPVAL
jgi:hypothetical protein